MEIILIGRRHAVALVPDQRIVKARHPMDIAIEHRAAGIILCNQRIAIIEQAALVAGCCRRSPHRAVRNGS